MCSREATAARQAVDLSGFRGEALNQSRSASGVYTGLYVSTVPKLTKMGYVTGKMQLQGVRRMMASQWKLRLLAHSLTAFGHAAVAGVSGI